MNPGRYLNIPNADYHAGPGISKSGLDKIAKSPAHYQSYLRKPQEETDAMRIGSALHKAVLEPNTFDDEYMTIDDAEICAQICANAKKEVKSPRATKEYKEWHANLLTENEGKAVLEPVERVLVWRMADSIHGHARAAELLTVPGTAEESFYWRDRSEGVLCRCRPDFLQADGYIVDLKTTTDASLEAFARSAAKFRYHVQAAFYLDGVEAVTGVRPKGFLFVVVEKSSPYAVAVYEATEDFIATGRAVMRENLHAYAECFFSGEWPGYPEVVMPLTLPRWATPTDTYDDEQEVA